MVTLVGGTFTYNFVTRKSNGTTTYYMYILQMMTQQKSKDYLHTQQRRIILLNYLHAMKQKL